jgi:phospholipase/lecithinase/hemolysin
MWRLYRSSKGEKMKNPTILVLKGIQLTLIKAKRAVAISLASLLLISATSHAAPISSVNVFGDSLSDSGSLAILAGGTFCPPPPYDGCRLSNGPVWAEQFAGGLGLAADTAYAGGSNYAIAGQRTDEVLNTQIPTFLFNNDFNADPDALYVVWAGGNDFLQNDPPGTFNPTTSVENVINSILGLSAAGAMDFFIPNLAVLDPWAFQFNAELKIALDSLVGLNIIQFDVFSLLLDVVTNPDDYGFTNALDPCLTEMGICANPDEYLLWDTVHPTTAGHAIIAAAALELVQPVQVPAPSTLVILGLGIAGLIRFKSKR